MPLDLRVRVYSELGDLRATEPHSTEAWPLPLMPYALGFLIREEW